MNLIKHAIVKQILPHIIAVAVFLVVAVLYCTPALDGKVLQQSDITNWKGSIQSSVEYAKTHNGNYPMWTNALFSGMPTVQIGGSGGSKILSIAHQICTLNLPAPIQFFFLASICFYILCCALKVRTIVAIITAIGYAYATYNPIIISVGHATKMWAIGYMPAVLGSIILVLNKKYWLGGVLTALFTGLLISVNHLQIAYYLFIAIGVMGISYFIHFAMQKQWLHIGTALLVTLAGIGIGVGANAEILMSTFEYQKETIRGGPSALTPIKDSTKQEVANTTPQTGLDKAYAFSYSMFKTEPLVLLVPRMYGGSSDHEELKPEESKAVEVFNTFPKELQEQLPPPSYYWGGLIDPISVGTSGPPYAGAIIVFLAIFAMCIIDAKYKWWMLATILLTCILSWGSYFPQFNDFVFSNLPFYNKFRAPSMIMVVPQLILCTLAALGLSKLLDYDVKGTELLKKFYTSCIVTVVIFIILIICYTTFTYISANDTNLLNAVREMGNVELTSKINEYIDATISDRKDLFLGDIGRSFGYILLAAFLIFAIIKKWFNVTYAIIGIGLLAFLDVALINTTYLNESKYQPEADNTANLGPRAKDYEILKDRTDYRVFNIGGDRFSENGTSYMYKSVGGYHPAKLRIYQDLIERQLSKNPPNIGVLSMLNTKYIVQRGRMAKDSPAITVNYQVNNEALGSAWYVQQVQYVPNADAEMKALDSIQPKRTAYVQEQYKKNIVLDIQYDSTAIIKLVKNDNDILQYESNSIKDGFGVFSEVYYKPGWQATIDGKPATIIKTNYVLRGLAVPAGKHNITFEFKPQGQLLGKQYASIANIILGIALLSIIGMLYMQYKMSIPNEK